MSFWRIVQILLLILFLACLAGTAFPVPAWLPAREVFHLDPLLPASVLLSDKALVSGLLLAGLILVLTLLLGRFFCAYICPLGTTMDGARAAFRRSGRQDAQQPGPAWRWVKHLVLLLLLLSALLGFNAAHYGSPLSLAGRFYVLVAGPVLHFLLKPALQLLEAAPLLPDLDLPLAGSPVSRYQALFFFIPLFLLLFGLTRITPRFWCRYLCPTGALLSLVGGRPLFRRRVSEACIDCGLCQKHCPMQAIPEEPRQTCSSECIVCQHCVTLCPVQAISFSARSRPVAAAPYLPGRRAALQTAALAGLTAALGRLGLQEYWPDGSQGHLTPASLIRPPGAVPESAFPNRCVRCGLCFTVCPTNMLQPAWLELGVSGLSSPLAVARRGPCEPQCAACGRVCPTGAIRPLPLAEKRWAKMGTAAIETSLCLAWEHDRSCLVCDEACPYGAISLARIQGQDTAVPFVDEDACTGCGFCEHACPVQGRSAIVVTPTGALRLGEGSFRETGRRLGLRLGEETAPNRGLQDSAPADGTSGDGSDSGLPPGFSP